MCLPFSGLQFSQNELCEQTLLEKLAGKMFDAMDIDSDSVTEMNTVVRFGCEAAQVCTESDHRVSDRPSGRGDRPECTPTRTTVTSRRKKLQTGRRSSLNVKRAVPCISDTPRVVVLLLKVRRLNSVDIFAERCEKIIEEWILLLRRTTWPSHVSSIDASVLAAFKAVDEAITGRDKLLSRLAHIQLNAMLQSLEDIVEGERRDPPEERTPGRRAVIHVLDIYKRVQSKVKRSQLHNRTRAMRRWTKLAGTSPFFLLFYPSAAEVVVYVFLALVFILKLTISKSRVQQDTRAHTNGRGKRHPGRLSCAARQHL